MFVSPPKHVASLIITNNNLYMNQRTTKPTIRHVQPGKTQICLCIHTDQSLLIACAFYSLLQGLTNPLPSCPGQVQILAGQVIFYFTCPEKCIEYIRNIVIPSYFQDAVDCWGKWLKLEFVRPCSWLSKEG